MCRSVHSAHSLARIPSHTLAHAQSSERTCYVLNYGIYKLHMKFIFILLIEKFQHFIQLHRSELRTRDLGRSYTQFSQFIYFRCFFSRFCFASLFIHFILMWLKLFRNTFILIVWCQVERSPRSLAHTLIQLKPHWKRNVIVIRFKRDNLHHIKAFVGQINVCAVLLDFNLHSSKSHLKLLNVYTHTLMCERKLIKRRISVLLSTSLAASSSSLLHLILARSLLCFLSEVLCNDLSYLKRSDATNMAASTAATAAAAKNLWSWLQYYMNMCVIAPVKCECLYTYNAIERYVKYAIIKLAPWKFNSMFTMWNNGTDIANIYFGSSLNQTVSTIYVGKFFLLLLRIRHTIYTNSAG